MLRACSCLLLSPAFRLALTPCRTRATAVPLAARRSHRYSQIGQTAVRSQPTYPTTPVASRSRESVDSRPFLNLDSFDQVSRIRLIILRSKGGRSSHSRNMRSSEQPLARYGHECPCCAVRDQTMPCYSHSCARLVFFYGFFPCKKRDKYWYSIDICDHKTLCDHKTTACAVEFKLHAHFCSN